MCQEASAEGERQLKQGPIAQILLWMLNSKCPCLGGHRDDLAGKGPCAQNLVSAIM